MKTSLQGYFDDEGGRKPPALSQKKIEALLEQRRNRRILFLLSLGSMLWTLLFLFLIFCAAKMNTQLATGMLVFGSIQISAACLFSCAVLRKRKKG